ncbi:MAG: KH domain-containing protein [Candidatus Anstonellaceae archaeon]
MAKMIMPGNEIPDYQKNNYTYSDEKGTYVTVIALQSEDGRIIPLEGPYQPNIDDYVIGKISELRFGGYEVDIKSPYKAFLPIERGEQHKFGIGEIIIAKITNVNEIREIELTNPILLKGGIVIRISPLKIPRLIGKNNSMINMISYATGCKIYIGKNGLVFVSEDGNYPLAAQVMKMVEKQTHTSGLTQKISDFLAKETNKEISIEKIQQHAQNQSQESGNKTDQSGFRRKEGYNRPQRRSFFNRTRNRYRR